MRWISWRRTVLGVGLLALGLAGSLQMEAPRSHPGAEPEGATKAQVQAAFAKLPLYFIENRGQVDPRVAYYVQGRGDPVLHRPGGHLCPDRVGDPPTRF